MLLGGTAGTDAITNIIDLPGQLVDIHDHAALMGLAVIAVLLIWPRLPRPLPHVPAYAVNHLEVPSILVCGHSGCAAMHGLLGGATIDGSLGRWLRWSLPSLQALRDGHPVGVAAAEEGRDEVDQLSMVNVARQVEVIGRHSAVRDAVTAGRVQVTGRFLDIRTARLLLLDPEAARFVPVPDDQLLSSQPPLRSSADAS